MISGTASTTPSELLNAGKRRLFSRHGLITGITRGTRRGHLARAAIEAICYQTKDIMIAMEKDSGLKIRSLKVDGGAVLNDLLCRCKRIS